MVVGAIHCVQTVDTEVLITVDTDRVVCTITLPLDVNVFVTGHVVTVV